MRKSQILIAGLAVLLLLGGGVYAWQRNNNDVKRTPPVLAAPISSQQSDDKEVDIDQTTSSTKEITKSGILTCLQSSPEASGQATSCALGLNADDKQIYSLQADDPMLIGSIPTGSRVRVTGTYIKQANSYNAAGIIKAQTVKRL